MPDIVGSEQRKPTSLWGIANKAKFDKQHRFENLYGCLTRNLLLQSWRDLNKKAAGGVDGVTAEEYAKNLWGNITILERRLKEKKYKAKLVRRKYIPKDAKGSKTRPLGSLLRVSQIQSALEDKIVQGACVKIPKAIYEQDFLPFCYGYRPGMDPKSAVGDLTFQLQYGVFGYIVEADIKGFFDNMDHDWILKMLGERIDDKAFIHLIGKWLLNSRDSQRRTGILEEDGEVIHPDTGIPQGGIVSPVPANLYLHHALDLWFEKVVKPHCRGEAVVYRFADDFVCAFRYRDDANRFYRVLPKRLGKFNLQVAPEKTQILRFSRFHPIMRRRFTFLGFEFFWFKDRKGTARVKRRSSVRKLRTKFMLITEWIRKNRHLPERKFFQVINVKLRGHSNYYGVRGNSQSMWTFYYRVIETCFKWLNRRSQRKSYTWERFKRNLELYYNILKPRITEKKRRHTVAY